MKTFKIGEKEYVLEFTFEAAEHKALVQNMFNIMSGAYIVKNGANSDQDEASAAVAVINGTSEMVADIPRICRVAFYAGMLENNPVSEDESKTLMKQYMKENGLSFYNLFEELKKCMEEDGFFVLSGLNDMIQTMTDNAEQATKKQPKTPQDHKKSTSTK